MPVRSVSGEFETNPWGEILNWGRCVKVESPDDIDAVHRLVDAPGDDRRAVVFEWLNRSRREALIAAIQATGLALRPFDDSDMAVAVAGRPSGAGRLLAVPGLPYLIFMRVRGRSTQMYEVTSVPTTSVEPATAPRPR